jgi:hypothetical protein
MRSLIILLLITACSGTLTDEQRKKIKENMAHGEIKKVTESEITDATFTWVANLPLPSKQKTGY